MNRAKKQTGMRIEETIKAGSGLYSIEEASQFAGVHPAKIRYWIFGTLSQSPLREPAITKEDGKFLTFYEFIEALAIKSLRVEGKASLQKIRAAITEASEKYGIKYPFAQKTHQTVLIGGEFHIFLEGDGPTGLTGKDKRQKSFKPCLEPFMDGLKFDEKKMASEYIVYRFGDGDNVITMNPRFCFGEPMVSNTGYTAETLYRAATAEGSMERAAKFYGVDRQFVVAACRYWEGLPDFASRN